MEHYLAARPSLANHTAVRACADQALDLLAPFHAELAPLLPALGTLWTHNDLHASNLFWSDRGPRSDVAARATAIIDFGLADRTNAVHDIANAIERNIVEWLALVQDAKQPPAVHLDHLGELLDGYESVRPLSGEEAAALAPMTALCHAEFALSEADYFLGLLHSEEKSGHGLRRLAGGPRALVPRRARPQAARLPAPPRRRRRALPAERIHFMIWAAIANYVASHAVELAGFVITALGIWLTTKRLLICWPVVLLADFLYLAVFYQARLYSDALLQVFFVVFTLYGWWHWWRGIRAEGEVRVVPLPRMNLLLALAAGAAGSFLLGAVAVRMHAALPHLDAALTSYSLVASWWQARKHTANWWLWIAVDTIYIGEYIYKDLLLTAVLYAGLVALAVLGLRDWRRAAAAA